MTCSNEYRFIVTPLTEATMLLLRSAAAVQTLDFYAKVHHGPHFSARAHQ